jgi:hypothetical protein
MRNYLVLGQWNTLCDRCGFKFKNVSLKKEWTGLMVCEECFELRNQQDFIRIKPEKVAPPWVRPEPSDQFVSICYTWERSCYADLATADCALADNTLLSYEYLLALKMGT